MSVQTKIAEGGQIAEQTAPGVSELLAVLKIVREFNCTHAPSLLHLPHFRNMDAAVFGALKAFAAREVQP